LQEEVINRALREIMNYYHGQGMAEEIGPGSRPAVLVVDFQKGLTDKDKPAGADMDREVNSTAALLEKARHKNLPVIFTVIAYHSSLKDGGLLLKKVPVLQNYLEGSEFSEIDARLEAAPEEPVLVKKYASCFYGTPLASMLTAQAIDTLIITGCITSGCIRATAVDSMQHGFRTIIPRECVADRSRIPHEVNLMDIQARYADVISLEKVLAYIDKLQHSS